MRQVTRYLTNSTALLLLLGTANSAFAAPTCQSASSDADGDGWGYENGASCLVASSSTPDAASACVDTGVIGDGWGWDGNASCRVGTSSSSTQPTTPTNAPASTCIDTGVIGDGWGWDGTGSCRVGTSSMQPASNQPSSGGAVCVDTPPLGNGWGWDGSGSCRVTGIVNEDPVEPTGPVAGTCEDTPPLNDGWGWDGTTGCQLPIEYPTAAACVDSNLDGVYTNGVSTCQPTLMNYSSFKFVEEYPQKPTIDGIDNNTWEWQGRRNIDKTLINLDGSNPNPGYFHAQHDGKYLYIMVQQYNSIVFTDSPGSTRLYDDGGWELYFNLGNERSTEYDVNDRHLMGDWGLVSSYGRPRMLNGINAERNLYPYIKCGSDNDLRTCEMRLSLSSLGVSGNKVQDIGFDFHVNGDNDGGERDYKLGYCGPAGADEAWRNPSSIRCAMRIRPASFFD